MPRLLMISEIRLLCRINSDATKRDSLIFVQYILFSLCYQVDKALTRGKDLLPARLI